MKTYISENISIKKCPFCGHSLYAAGTWNTKIGSTFLKHCFYCSGCRKYFAVSIKETTKEKTREEGVSIV